LRKFKTLYEYKLTQEVSQLTLTDSGLVALVTKSGSICICKVIEEEIQSLVEF